MKGWGGGGGGNNLRSTGNKLGHLNNGLLKRNS